MFYTFNKSTGLLQISDWQNFSCSEEGPLLSFPLGVTCFIAGGVAHKVV